MDIANMKLGPCPRCFDHIKPCRCEMVLKSDLRKLEEEWRKYEKIMLDDYQVALSDWSESWKNYSKMNLRGNDGLL